MGAQYFSTDKGVAMRVADDPASLRLLDVPASSLHDALTGGSLDTLASASKKQTVPLESVRFRAPYQPGRIVIVGLNYMSHAEEVGHPRPTELMFVPPAPPGQTVIASGEPIVLPSDHPNQVDYESEIALIIGRGGTKVSASEAWSHISGVTAVNDVTARDLQAELGANVDIKTVTQAQLAEMGMAPKMLPSFKPLGPGVLHPADVRADGVRIQAFVNGELRQDATSEELIFPIPNIIELLSAVFPLQPGDLILTGSPAGIGFFSGSFLQPGDLVEVVLSDLPPLSNRVAA